MDEEYGGHYYCGPEAWDRSHLIRSATSAAEKSVKPQLIHRHRFDEKCLGHSHLRVTADAVTELEYRQC